jgi:branched-chain amino acid transport system ATP-binding protein
MAVVFSISEQIFVLHQGKLIASGQPDEVRANPNVQKVYIGDSRNASRG